MLIICYTIETIGETVVVVKRIVVAMCVISKGNVYIINSFRYKILLSIVSLIALCPMWSCCYGHLVTSYGHLTMGTLMPLSQWPMH